MTMIKTKSFELAVNTEGDTASPKFAIIIPGRLDTKDYAHNTALVSHLASLGFYAISFDPPGTWGSSGNIELYTTTNYLKAIDEIIEYFGNKPTLLIGHSRGGTVAILAASNPHVGGIVAIMASYGAPTPPNEEAVKSGFQISQRDLPPGTFKTIEQKVFSLPISYFVDGEKYHPAQSLQKITKPKLLIFGAHDEFTSPDTVKSLFTTLPDPKMLREIHFEHDYRYHHEAIQEVNEIISDFISNTSSPTIASTSEVSVSKERILV